jgi:F-type H+-transporting ATPase subunit c
LEEKMNKLSRILPVLVALLLVSNPALAGDGGGHAFDYLGYVGLGAGVAIGFAALGGGIGQGIAASGALQGIARNPSASDKIFTPMIIGLALIESLVIYALVIGFMLTGKIDNVGDATTNSSAAANEAELTHSTAEMKKGWENADAKEARDEAKKEAEDN